MLEKVGEGWRKVVESSKAVVKNNKTIGDLNSSSKGNSGRNYPHWE